MRSYKSFSSDFFLILAAGLTCQLALSGCSKKGVAQGVNSERTSAVETIAPNQKCEEAGKKALGAEAVVLACGQLTHSGALETLVAIRLRRFKDTDLGIPVSSFAILREDQPTWKIELIADKMPVRNSVGYVGVTDIDDSDTEYRYRISPSGGKFNEKEPISVLLRYIDPNGETEAWPLDIDWNPAVQRFQEYSDDAVNPGFRPEIKNPKHFRSR